MIGSGPFSPAIYHLPGLMSPPPARPPPNQEGRPPALMKKSEFMNAPVAAPLAAPASPPSRELNIPLSPPPPPVAPMKPPKSRLLFPPKSFEILDDNPLPADVAEAAA